MNLFASLFDIFFPKVCLACKNPLLPQEKLICHNCLSNLPLTGIPFDNNNPVYEKLIPIVQIENATSILFFDKSGVVQELIHHLKYNNHPEIGAMIAGFMELTPRLYKNLSQIDYIVPVPLHPKKLKKRGYNQLTEFARKLEEMYQIKSSEKILIKEINTETQTKKTRSERLQNVSNAFTVQNPENYKGKHFLIVDDVITTGATLEACTETILNQVENAKVSILTMSFVLQ